ncbi:hypothetical protein C6A85_91365 [Mycobacterium sp. ITM-2017-0098]|nr:hypothetical protein C6A85_91365 [Mycobacterium sp. ITM-2017-0098]
MVLREDRVATAHDLREYLVDRVAKWWIPESFTFVTEVPKTSVGKFDKKALRQRLADGELTVERSAATRVPTTTQEVSA